MKRRRLSAAAARRTVLAAQGFDRPRPACAPSVTHLRNAINRLGILQLDFVNVLVPAHLMVLFSRLGPYDRNKFHDFVYRGREYIEHWAHEASIVPSACWPMLAYRRQSFRPWPRSPIMKLRGRQQYLAEVLEAVQRDGPLTAHDLPPVQGPRRKSGDWHRSVPRWALEVHFGKGAVSVADRLGNFQRVYDVPERVIDEPHYSADVPTPDAKQQLLAMAARSFGVATLRDLADYFRMTAKEAAPGVAELVASGELVDIEVEGWGEPAYLHRDARVPRAIECASLVSPFDPLVWYRPRTERLFDFHYRIEIYVPTAKRRWGYYVLPFLLDDRIVARVDLKADRKERTLQVLAAHLEDDVDTQRVAESLATELHTLGRWLELDDVRVTRTGKLAPALARHC